METQTTPSSGVAEGSIVRATVTRIEASAALVNFGWKSDGPIALAEFPKVAGMPSVKPGDTFEVLVEWLDEDPKEIVLSREKAELLRRWESMAAKAEQGALEGTVVGRNKGGYEVDLGGIAGFLPNSQASHRKLDLPDSLIGQRFTFDVSRVDADKVQIVLSRKSRAKEEEESARAVTMAKVKEGAILHGVVRAVTDFGAFVELGNGVDGLLHVSQMSWAHVGHPREVVRAGQELDVQVLGVEASKISLGLKQLIDDPWAHAAQRHPSGSTIEGKVRGFAEFGAFVEIEPGVEGMIHVSEMSWTKKVKHPSDVLKEGETVKATVLQVDPDHRRISLGLRQLLENPWKVLAEKYPEGTTVKGKIRRITDFGMFVELEEGIDGLVHVSELTWNGKVNHPSELHKEGAEVEAIVLKVDPEDQRIALSIKQLQPSPWKTFGAEHPVGSKLKARVARIVDFGAFLEAAPGIEGLLHVSEIREDHVERVGDVLRVGQEVEVQVVELDLGRRKIGFSIKAMTAISPEEYREHMKQADVKVKLGDVFKDQLTKKE